MADEVPDIFEPLYAYRGWEFRAGRLRSTIRITHFWQAGENIASCRGAARSGSAHKVADGQCSCGFYGAWSLEHPAVSAADIQGVVAFYGRITPAEWGLRAEKARIVALSVKPPLERWVRPWHEYPALTRMMAAAWGMQERDLVDYANPLHPRNVLSRRYPGVAFVDSNKELRKAFPVSRPDHLLNPELNPLQQTLGRLVGNPLPPIPPPGVMGV